MRQNVLIKPYISRLNTNNHNIDVTCSGSDEVEACLKDTFWSVLFQIQVAEKAHSCDYNPKI